MSKFTDLFEQFVVDNAPKASNYPLLFHPPVAVVKVTHTAGNAKSVVVTLSKYTEDVVEGYGIEMLIESSINGIQFETDVKADNTSRSPLIASNVRFDFKDSNVGRALVMATLGSIVELGSKIQLPDWLTTLSNG